MTARIVLFGATGYTGARTAEALVVQAFGLDALTAGAAEAGLLRT